MHIDDEMPDDSNNSNSPVLYVTIKTPQAATQSSAGTMYLASALISVVFPVGV